MTSTSRGVVVSVSLNHVGQATRSVMNFSHKIAELISTPEPPPAGGWVNDLPEAFGALDENGEVFVIGYRGEWYTPVKPSLRVRLHNWLIRGRQPSAVDELCEAIRLTVEYVGTETLYPGEGWSWFDALQKYRPDLAAHFVDWHQRMHPAPVGNQPQEQR